MKTHHRPINGIIHLMILVSIGGLFVIGCGPSNPKPVRSPDKTEKQDNQTVETAKKTVKNTDKKTEEQRTEQAGTAENKQKRPTLVYYKMPG